MESIPLLGTRFSSTNTPRVVFGSQSINYDNEEPMIVEGKVIDYLTDYRYLGMSLDGKLNYTENIKEVMRKVNHKIWILANVRKYLTTNMVIKICRGMILPYFD